LLRVEETANNEYEECEVNIFTLQYVYSTLQYVYTTLQYVYSTLQYVYSTLQCLYSTLHTLLYIHYFMLSDFSRVP